MAVTDRITRAARRVSGQRALIIGGALLLTVASILVVRERLRFNTDLADLLPADHPALQVFRRIQAKYPSDTGFMVVLSRSLLFATDADGHALVHDGERWQRTATGGSLHAVWGLSASDVFAAGSGGRVLRYRGGAWRATAPTGTRATLRGLWGARATALYAVGDGGVALRFDGRRWQPLPAPTRLTLRAVSGNAGGAVYAVGDGATVLRLDAGGAWRREAVPARGVTLRSVWAGERELAFAVGDGGLVLRRGDDGKWQRLASPAARDLHAVWGESADCVLAVGDGGTALRYDGERLQAEIFRVQSDMRALHGLTCERAWAAADDGALERRTVAVRRQREGRHVEVHWWDGPLDTPPRQAGVLWPWQRRASAPPPPRFTALWRPPNDMRRAIAQLPALAARLARSPLVGRVEYKKPAAFFTDRALYFLPVADLRKLRDELQGTLDREAARASGLYVDLDEGSDPASERRRLARLLAKYRGQALQHARSEHYLHYDGASVGIAVFSHKGASDVATLRTLHAEIARIVGDRDWRTVDPLLRVDVGGDGLAKIREYDVTVGDISRLGWLAIGAVSLLLLIYFRRPLGTLLVILPLGMSLTWTFGLTALTIGTLNAVTGFLFAVLFGLGIDFGLQLFGRYRESRERGLDHEQALDRMLLDTGQATATGALTSAVALFLLMVTDFRGFSEFGFIAGTGVLFALASFLLVLPALLGVADRLGALRFAPPVPADRPAAEREPRRRPPLSLRASRPIAAASLLFAAFGVLGVLRARFEHDHRVLRPAAPPDEIMQRAGQCFGESFTPTLLLADSQRELRAALDAIERRRQARGAKSTVRRSMSILSLVPDRQPEKAALLADLSRLLHSKRWKLVSDEAKRRIRLDRLRSMARARPFAVRDLPPAIRRSFRGPGFGDAWLGMVYYNANMSDTRDARRFKEEVGTFSGSPLLSLGRLLPAGARAFIEGQRVEVACPPALRTACRDALAGLRHGGAPAFAKVLTREEAEAAELGVEGALRGSLLAVARDGLIPVAERLAAAIVPSGTFHVSSGELVLTDVVEVMLRDGRVVLVVSLGAILVGCFLAFRRPRLALLAFMPLGMGLLWTFALLYLLQLKLNMFNFVVLPVLVGIGIDYGVHVVHRYDEEGPGQLARVARVLFWVLLFCFATTVGGFGTMALAEHPGLRSLGQLAIIGLACIFVTSTVALPAWLARFGPRTRAEDEQRADKR